MRAIILTLIMLSVCFGYFSQTVFLKSNLTGEHRITTGDNQEILHFEADSLYKVDLTNKLEIEFDENQATIQFNLSDYPFKENDTLTLGFIHYHDIDTTWYTSSCLDGSNAVDEESYKEHNPRAIEINKLPEYLDVWINQRKIRLLKSVNSVVYVSTGSGKKKGKRWGYSQQTPSKQVVYTNE